MARRIRYFCDMCGKEESLYPLFVMLEIPFSLKTGSISEVCSKKCYEKFLIETAKKCIKKYENFKFSHTKEQIKEFIKHEKYSEIENILFLTFSRRFV